MNAVAKTILKAYDFETYFKIRLKKENYREIWNTVLFNSFLMVVCWGSMFITIKLLYRFNHNNFFLNYIMDHNILLWVFIVFFITKILDDMYEKYREIQIFVNEERQEERLNKLYKLLDFFLPDVSPIRVEALISSYKESLKEPDEKYSQIVSSISVITIVPLFFSTLNDFIPDQFRNFYYAMFEDTDLTTSGAVIYLVALVCGLFIILNWTIRVILKYYKFFMNSDYSSASFIINDLDTLLLQMDFNTGEAKSLPDMFDYYEWKF